MAYEIVRNMQTEYAVDWTVVDRLVHSYWKAYMQDTYCNVVTTSDSVWYNPMSWSLPEVEQLEVDWETVRGKALSAFESDKSRMHRLAQTSVRDVAYDVLWKVRQTVELKNWFLNQMAEIQKKNGESIGRSVEKYEGYKEAAKFIRDVSFDTVGVGATIVTGGAGVALLGGSSILKGWGKYQDTDNLGVATMQAAGSFTFGAFKLPGGNLSKTGEYVLIVVQGGYESSMSLVAGQTLSEAAQKGLLKIAGDGGAKLLANTELAKLLFSKISLPIKIVSRGEGGAVEDVTQKVFSKVTEKIGAKTVATAGKKLFGHSNAEKNEGSRVGVAQDALLADELLLKLAVVNMERGIGRGW
jgi:hypothetical protein